MDKNDITLYFSLGMMLKNLMEPLVLNILLACITLSKCIINWRPRISHVHDISQHFSQFMINSLFFCGLKILTCGLHIVIPACVLLKNTMTPKGSVIFYTI